MLNASSDEMNRTTNKKGCKVSGQYGHQFCVLCGMWDTIGMLEMRKDAPSTRSLATLHTEVLISWESYWINVIRS